MSARHPTLPRLAFGHAIAEDNDDLAAFTAAQRAVMPSIRRYEPLRSRQTFLHRAATVRAGDVRLVASASTPLAMAADESVDSTLIIPLHGWGTSVIDRCAYRWQAGCSAMFIPGCARTGESGVRSVVAITFDPNRLRATARVMFGSEAAGRADLGLGTARLVPIGSPSPGLTLLRHTLSLVDVARGEPTNMRLLGLDDSLLRSVAMLLAPEALARTVAPARGHDSTVGVHKVTDYIVGHLEERITLTDMERVSGLPARSLQLAFRKAHGCSPRAWIQRRRIHMARERLLASRPNDTVAAIAMACGFTRLATFSAAYTRRYGESPSVTLARTQTRKGRPEGAE